MEGSINDILIHRFLNKETSVSENKEILCWISASEENKTQFRKIHQVFYATKQKQFLSGIDVDQAWNRFNSQIPKVIRTSKVVSMEVFRRIAVAALVLLTIGFGSLWTKEHFFTSKKPAVVCFEAPKGEKSKIILADGTLVWLNSQTILKYDVSVPRKVNVDGEAYFEVKKDSKHPFEVSTASGMKVKVTGTRFNLRSLSSEAFVETTLDEGVVIIEDSNFSEIAVLNPGQQAKYNIQTKQLNVQNVSTEIYSLWKNNELRFKDISFAELVPRIERWYGVSIKLDSLVNRDDRFTMTIKTESLRELLEMMQLTSKFDYEVIMK
ncbi:MAG: DUF4974 domain-containing protein [Bacteroidetes bacterium]|nr:DUF4974 domain-containing protein [Bacteroidota bacterium]